MTPAPWCEYNVNGQAIKLIRNLCPKLIADSK